MCTMLAFIMTDVAISRELLQKALSSVVKDTYNMISVDGDTSTNDTALLLANGLAGNPVITEENEDYETFVKALYQVNETLAKTMAGDGEGATALFECKVIHAKTKDCLLYTSLNDDKVRLMMNHINNEKRDSFNGHSPYELSLLLLDNKLHKALGLKAIAPDDVMLSPNLLK